GRRKGRGLSQTQQTLNKRILSGNLRKRDYEVLNRCRLIPSFLIFDSSVCRGMPNLAAAPVGPEIIPSVSRSAFSIISFARSTRLATRGTLVPADLGATRV